MTMHKLKPYLALSIVALVLVLAAQNAVVVEIRFLFWTVSMSRALVLLFTLLAGAALGWVACGLIQRRRRSSS
jgi:lipopolysaccharide assembly protein A